MNPSLVELIIDVGVPSVFAITAFAYGVRSKKLSRGWRIVALVAAAVSSIPGLFALYILMIFASAGGGHW